MVITAEADVRRLVGRPIDVSQAQMLADAITAGDREIKGLTGRDDWANTDSVFGTLQNIGAVYAAYTILIGWDKEEYLEKAKELWKSYVDAVASFRLIPLPEDKTDPNVDMAFSESLNPYVNPNNPHFMSQY